MCSISFLALFTYPWTFFLCGQWILHCLQTSSSHRRLRQRGGPFSPQLPVTAFCHLSQWWLHFSSCISKEVGSHPSLLYLTHSLCKSHWLDLHNHHQESSQVFPPPLPYPSSSPPSLTSLTTRASSRTLLLPTGYHPLISHIECYKVSRLSSLLGSKPSKPPHLSPKETHSSSYDLLLCRFSHVWLCATP